MKKGSTHSQETKNRISQVKKGSTHSQETKDKMARAALGNSNGKGYRHTKEAKDAISTALKGRLINGRTLTVEHKQNIANALMGHIGCNHTDDTKLAISNALKGRLKSVETKVKMAQARVDGKLPHNKYFKRPTYTAKNGQTITFRSGWEGKVAVYLDRHGIWWEYELDVLVLDSEAYLPDFFIFNGTGKWIGLIEVKGWFPQAEQVKMVRYQEALSALGITLEIWDRKKLKELRLL